MLHLLAQSDIAYRYGVTAGAVTRWLQADSFPTPAATYGPSRRPLFDPAAVDAWIRAHRPEYVTRGVQS